MTYHDPTISELLRDRTWSAPVYRDDVIQAARTAGVDLVDGRIPRLRIGTVRYEVERIARNRSLIDSKHYFDGESYDFALCRRCNAPRKESCHYPEAQR